MSIGERVKELRESKGLKQSVVASIAGIDVRALRDIENRTTKNPSLATVKGLATALGVQPEDIVGDEPVERPAPKSRASAPGPKSAREAVQDDNHYLRYLFKHAGIESEADQLEAADQLDKRYRNFEKVTPMFVDLWLESYVPSRTSRKQRRAGP